MRICYLGDAGSPHMAKFVEYFAGPKNEIHVISLRKGEYRTAAVHHIPRRTPFEDVDYLLGLFWLKRTIASIKPDILHAHYLTSFGLLGALTGYHPFVVTAWGTDLLVTPGRGFVYRRLLKYTLRKADLIFADADFMKEELLRYGAPPEKILICPFGVNTQLFTGESRVHEDKTSYGILSMRTLIKNSNLDVILKSLSLLKEKGIGFTLYVTNQGAEEPYLRRMSRDLGLDSRINFLGFLERGEVFEYFRGSDIYLSIPTSDGASVTLLEAMASGLFPIVSDIPANREWIRDGINGFLVPLRHAKALADKILVAVEDKELRGKAAEINRNLVRKKGELRKTMEYIGSRYRQLADRG